MKFGAVKRVAVGSFYASCAAFTNFTVMTIAWRRIEAFCSSKRCF